MTTKFKFVHMLRPHFYASALHFTPLFGRVECLLTVLSMDCVPIVVLCFSATHRSIAPTPSAVSSFGSSLGR